MSQFWFLSYCGPLKGKLNKHQDQICRRSYAKSAHFYQSFLRRPFSMDFQRINSILGVTCNQSVHSIHCSLIIDPPPHLFTCCIQLFSICYLHAISCSKNVFYSAKTSLLVLFISLPELVTKHVWKLKSLSILVFISYLP